MFLSSGSKLVLSEEIVLPFKIIEPSFILSSPAIVLKIVVFPIPEGPKRHITSPFFSIEKDTFLTLVFPPTLKLTFLTSKKFLFICFSKNIF